MRGISLLLAGVVIASCAIAAVPERSPDKDREFHQAVGGKVARAPQDCMPYSRGRDMVVLDQNSVLFKTGRDRVYVAHMSAGCSNLGGPGPYALVTRQTTGSLCHGDIADVVDTMAHMTVGSCTFDNFVPYVER